VRKRLQVYHDQTEPLIKYYRDWSLSGDPDAPHYIKINGIAPVEKVRDEIFEILENR